MAIPPLALSLAVLSLVTLRLGAIVPVLLGVMASLIASLAAVVAVVVQRRSRRRRLGP